QLNNPTFKLVEFDQFKNESGSNTFVLSPQKWIKTTNAKGIVSKSGRYGGGTFAHKDIAFEFASWVSPEFKLYIIKDYQRLKEEESVHFSFDWDVKRILAKANYKIHTSAIKDILIPINLPKNEQSYIYADEADVLNIALFGKTAKQWRTENQDKKGNIRDYASIEQLLVLINLENTNALLIKQFVSQNERLIQLRNLAVEQLLQLSGTKSISRLNELHNQEQLPNK
ncbi:MAG: KilA-N domain-containing protein, partial [Oscillospiraceae bacterium]